MSQAGSARTALVVDSSPRWRAQIGDCLRSAGWTVIATASPSEELAAPAYQLVVLEVRREALAFVQRLAGSATQCVLLVQAPEAEGLAAIPAELREHPQVLGSLYKGSYSDAALLSLVAPLGPRPLPVNVPEAGPKALVVEDDVHWRAIYAELVAEAGFVPCFAVSYGEARGWLQRAEFALAIVDLNLASSAAPEGNRDGFYLLRAARQRGLPAIVVSALGDPDDIDRAYDDFGIFAFIEKEGFDRRSFLSLLAEAAGSASAARATSGVAPAADGLEGLTRREREVLALLSQGYTNRQIAEALLITPNTTKKHVDHILQKLGVSTRAAAVAVALRASSGA